MSEPAITFVWPHFWVRYDTGYVCQVCGEVRAVPVLFGCPGRRERRDADE